MNVKLAEIAKIVNAKNEWQQWGDVTISKVEFDSRKVEHNDLFVPLQGARDGHGFLQTAIDSGASVALWSRELDSAPTNFPILQVDNTLVAMQKIAHYYLQKVNPKVVGVTGSNGKTTTKDMVAAVLSQEYITYKTQGNYNNDIGLPYTITQMPPETEMLVLEMGMDHKGEIQFLSKLATPDVAAITIVGESHIEFLGSRQGIAEAKMEIVEGLDKEGLLIVPSAEPLLIPLVENLTQRVQKFGEANSDVQGTILERTKKSTTFSTNLFKDEVFTIPVLGDYNVDNALIAVIVGDYFNVSPEKIKKGLSQMNLTQNRTEWMKAWNGAEILSDVYNANPTAMALVLDTFSELDCKGDKKIVLADMGELGVQEIALHKGLKEHICPERFQEVYLYGTLMENLYKELLSVYPDCKLHYYGNDEKKQLIAELKENLGSTDMLMLKGSNSMKLVEIVENLSEK